MTLPHFVITGLFLVPLGMVCGVACYTDIRYGKIKNAHMAWGFGYVALLYLFLLWYGVYVLNQPSNAEYVMRLALNGCVALMLGYALWRFDLWAAGDAKLFSLIAFLVPLEFYARSYVPYFPALTLLVDAFVLTGIAFLLGMLKRGVRYGSMLALRAVRGEWCAAFFAMGREFWVQRGAIRAFAIETVSLFALCTSALVALQYATVVAEPFLSPLISSHPLLIKAFLFAFQVVALGMLGKNKWFARAIMGIGLLCGAALVATGRAAFLWDTVRTSALFLLFVGVGMQLVYKYLEAHETKSVKPHEVQAGSFVTAQSMARLGARMQEGGKGEVLGACGSDGLTRAQANSIQQAFRDDPQARIQVYKTFFFAPFMVAALLLALFFKGSVLFVLVR